MLELSYVFISYSREDSDYAFTLRDFLENHGFSTWIDEKIEDGSRWWKIIEKSIENCSAFIVIMTPSSNDSEWVEKEYMLANRDKKPIFPVLLKGRAFGFFVNVQFEILQTNRDYFPSIGFLDNLQKYVPRTPQERTPPTPFNSSNKNTHIEFDNLLIDIAQWSDNIRQGSTDFYGLAMLALSYEERDQHERAIYFMKKSRKLEPRIIDFEWMIENYNWTEGHINLCQEIVDDEAFWSSNIN